MPAKFQDYYSTLGVSRDADPSEIKRAYRNLARQHHPDKAEPSARPAAEAKIKEINEAYEVLKDPEKRKKYDRFGKDWDQPDPGVGRRSHRQAGPRGDPFSRRGGPEVHFGGTGFSDFFEEMFGGGAGFAGAQQYGRPGQDTEADLMVSLHEVAQGAVRQITLRRRDPITGGEETYPLKVRIPVGVREGQRLRVPGRGAAGSGGGSPGDLFLRVHFEPHPDFRVKDGKLHYELELAPWEAVLGTKVDIPTLDRPVRLTIKPGTRGGRPLRVRGRGLPTHKGGSPGDLYVDISIAVPESLTPAERELWEKLAETSDFRPRG